MEDNLDFSPSNDQNLRKAKTTFHLLSGIFILAVFLPLLYYSFGIFDSHYNIIELSTSILLLIMLFLSIIALFYIVKSYYHKEDKKNKNCFT